MSPREKQVAVGGFLVLAAMALIQFVIHPMNREIARTQAIVAGGDQALHDLRGLSEGYLQLKGDLDRVRERIAKQKGDAGALSVLEGMEKECGLMQSNVSYMKPEPAVVADGYAQAKITIRLESISEGQMKQLLKRIQSADLPMGVRSLELRTSRKTPGMLDATIEVVSVTPAGKG
jgi:hypothetical protein